jgi:hypothetical protein
LFLPKRSRNGVTFERLDVDNSNLVEFNRSEHIVPLKNKSTNTASTTSSFEPVAGTVSGDDFDL